MEFVCQYAVPLQQFRSKCTSNLHPLDGAEFAITIKRIWNSN